MGNADALIAVRREEVERRKQIKKALQERMFVGRWWLRRRFIFDTIHQP